MTDGDSFSHVLKLSIWGEPEPDNSNPLWGSKFTGTVIHPKDSDGDQSWTEYVIDPGFTTEKLIEDRNAGLKKATTKHARNVTTHGVWKEKK